MWAFDESQVTETLELILAHFENHHSEDVTLSQLTNNLLLWIEKEMQKNGLHIPPFLNEWTQNDLNVSAIDYTRVKILEWLTFIKDSRNLGSRLNMIKAIEYMRTNYMNDQPSKNCTA